MWKPGQHRMTPKYDMLSSFFPLVKNYHVTYVDDENKPFKVTCKNCNGFLRCAIKSGEQLYIGFIHEGMSTIII